MIDKKPRWLRRNEVLDRVPFSGPTLDRMVRAGKFPAPVKVGKRAVAWLDIWVDDWSANLAQQRAADLAPVAAE